MQTVVWPGGSDATLFWMAAAWIVLIAVFAMLFLALLRGERTRGEVSLQLARVGEIAGRVASEQARMSGHVEQMQVAFNDHLERLSHRLSEGLRTEGERTGETLRALYERLALLDSAQKHISTLSEQVIGLQDILANKQARGAFGEVQLYDLVKSMLPPSAFVFQPTLGNRTRADCLLRLPDPPGSIVIDAKFPLESYRALRAATSEADRERAGRSFAADVLRHVRAIQEKYIIPGETADGAMMFLPSEAVYAEIHAGYRTVVEDSFRRKVWIVSPTTLWATLNTVRAILRDVSLREQAGVIQAELCALAEEIGRMDERISRLSRHHEQIGDDIRQVRSSAERVLQQAGRIDLARLGEDPAVEAPLPSVPPLASTAASAPPSPDPSAAT
jgi:DNA recombination protein RmuC